MSYIIVPLLVLFILLALPFGLVKITELESRSEIRINRAVSFYRRYPKLLIVRRYLSTINVIKWHKFVTIFCIVLSVLVIAASGYFPEEKRVETVISSFITLLGTYLFSYCLISIKAGHTELLVSRHYKTIYRHINPIEFWLAISTQLLMAIFMILMTSIS